MSVYKKFTPQDYSVVPFNAHKQYNLNSSSAVLNNVKFFNTKYTASNIDVYSSSSIFTEEAVILGQNFDNIKYSQLDHLFYRNYKSNSNDTFGDIDYLKHYRVLYEKCTTMSIPSGLYGHKIKPGSLEFSAGSTTFVDDTYGNLYVKNNNLDHYITDPRLILADLGPVKGFKRYDLNVYENVYENTFYRRGQSRVNNITSYSTPISKHEYDDSYFSNKIYYNNVNFSEVDLGSDIEITKKFPQISFLETNSEVIIEHNNNLNFNKENQYTLEFFITSVLITHDDEIHVLSKSTTQTSSPIPHNNDSFPETTINKTAENQYPFKITLKKGNGTTTNRLCFSVSDGENSTTTLMQINVDTPTHITCVRDKNTIKIYKNGNTGELLVCTNKNTNNLANVYIGGGSEITSLYNNRSFSGSICNFKMYDTSFSSINVVKHHQSKNGSPYVGNVFYSHGFANITHPAYISQYGILGIGDMQIDNNDVVENNFTVGGILISSANWLQNIKFQGSHLIYENEYKCTVDEFEYNNTFNLTARKNKSLQEENKADFTTGSLFKPYITTIGLYNENNELLVVGKLGQPIRTSNETDTTFIVRWDT